MVERIRQIMQHKLLSASQFADGIEVPRAVISHILSERNKPSLDVILKIISVHRDISMEWLLLGEGEMLNKLVAGDAKESNGLSDRQPVDTVHQDVAPTTTHNRKVQEEVVQPDKQAASTAPAKTIERVLIFYTDQTFSSYTPG